MIGLDTNVLVRYFTQDDPEQAALATRVIEDDLSDDRPGFISVVVIVECAWVLGRLYGASAAELHEIIDALLGSPTMVVENRGVIARALVAARQNGGGFADAVITASAQEARCDRVLTFDRGALGVGMTLLH